MARLMVIRTTLALGALVLSTGCASIMNSGYSGYPVTTNPPGAKVIANGVTFLGTPILLAAKRDMPHMIRIEREGCPAVDTIVASRLSGWVWGNLLLGGIIGLIVDLGNEAAYELHPTHLAVQYGEVEGKCIIAGSSVMGMTLAGQEPKPKPTPTQAKVEMGYIENTSR